MECSRAELLDFVSVAQRAPDLFTEWEKDFLASLRRQLKFTSASPRQIDTLDRTGVLRKCWSNDPDLWR